VTGERGEKLGEWCLLSQESHVFSGLSVNPDQTQLLNLLYLLLLSGRNLDRDHKVPAHVLFTHITSLSFTPSVKIE